MLGKRLIRIVLLLVILALAGSFAMPEQAQARKRRIVIQEGTKVSGKIIRPEMSLILQRSKINYEALKQDKSFLDRIVKSVRHEPF